jgi:hypothetical protein
VQPYGLSGWYLSVKPLILKTRERGKQRLGSLKTLLAETQDNPSFDSIASLFLPKKFPFKPTGAPTVSNVIKKVFHNEDEEEEDDFSPKAIVSLKPPIQKKVLFRDD